MTKKRTSDTSNGPAPKPEPDERKHEIESLKECQEMINGYWEGVAKELESLKSS